MSTDSLNQILRGALAMSSLVAGLFFFRFRRVTGDRLFTFLGFAFWALAANWIVLGLAATRSETLHPAYLLRLLAFLLILAGIFDKNRRGGGAKL